MIRWPFSEKVYLTSSGKIIRERQLYAYAMGEEAYFCTSIIPYFCSTLISSWFILSKLRVIVLFNSFAL